MDVNYDQIRVGRTFDIRARHYADDRVKDMAPEEADVQRPVFYNERLNALIEQHNKDSMKKMPASGLIVTEETKDVMVVRYKLKNPNDLDGAEAVIKRREEMAVSIDWDQNPMTLDNILLEKFEIHVITMEQAAENRELYRSPKACIHAVRKAAQDAEPPKETKLFEKKPEVVPDAVEDIQADPFADLPPIPGRVLSARMDLLELRPYDVAKKLSTEDEKVNQSTVKSWMNRGVPDHMIVRVREALKQ